MNVQTALTGQYHAALAMLREAIERCPAELWADGAWPVAFWRVAYHTLFYTHLYLQKDVASFRPWAHHRDGCQRLESRTDAEDPYTKEQILDYWRCCDDMVDSAVAALDLSAPECGFPWYRLGKLEHQITSIRHIQHHAALLAGRLRLASGADVRWVGPM